MAQVGMQRGLKVGGEIMKFDQLAVHRSLQCPNLIAIRIPVQNYIQELRGCSTKEAEKERVDKELGKIRKKYTSEKSLSGL